MTPRRRPRRTDHLLPRTDRRRRPSRERGTQRVRLRKGLVLLVLRLRKLRRYRQNDSVTPRPPAPNARIGGHTRPGPIMAHSVHEPSRPSPAEHRAERLRRAGVEVVYAADRPTVVVTGQVDRSKITEVSGTVRGLLAVGVNDLVVDLTHAWDSAALLSVLARTRAELADQGGTLRLVGVALPEFLGALTAAPLDEVFLVYDAVRRTVDDAALPRQTRPTASLQRRTDWSL
jgi:hypothetical protein